MNDVTIMFYGCEAQIVCDRRCDKAWGVNSRPHVHLSGCAFDFVFLADGELRDAPDDPGTRVVGESKPLSPDHFPSLWCLHECERSALSLVCGLPNLPMPLDFSRRIANMQWRRMLVVLQGAAI